MKTDILSFLENKRLFAKPFHVRLLIYPKAIYGQKMKEIGFPTLATRSSIFPDCLKQLQSCFNCKCFEQSMPYILVSHFAGFLEAL